MATAPLTVKLRCSSWRQLRTIYQRDLSRGAFFLKTKKPPPIGTPMRIQLTLPSESMVILRGEIGTHVPEGGLSGRGPGIDIKLTNIPQSALWLIETALKAEKSDADPVAARKRAPERAAAPAVASKPPGSDPIAADSSMDEGVEQDAAESRLLEALAEEYESLQKLNPFQILGVGYETSDDKLRASFGELTKKYHPDRFRRFDNDHIREYASEIFILIRNAYQQLSTEDKRSKTRELLRTGRAKRSFRPPTLPNLRERRQIERADTMLSAAQRLPGSAPNDRKRAHPPVKAPPGPSSRPPGPPIESAGRKPKSIARESTPARSESPLQAGIRLEAETARDRDAERRAAPSKKPAMPAADAQVLDDELLDSDPAPSGGIATSPESSGNRFARCEALLDAEDFPGARKQYELILRKDPKDAQASAGLELTAGLEALAAGDRLEAAQRFEMVLDLDPSNERAARELAEMRRRATNQRKGLLTKLLGERGKG